MNTDPNDTIIKIRRRQDTGFQGNFNNVIVVATVTFSTRHQQRPRKQFLHLGNGRYQIRLNTIEFLPLIYCCRANPDTPNNKPHYPQDNSSFNQVKSSPDRFPDYLLM